MPSFTRRLYSRSSENEKEKENENDSRARFTSTSTGSTRSHENEHEHEHEHGGRGVVRGGGSPPVQPAALWAADAPQINFRKIRTAEDTMVAPAARIMSPS